MPKTIAVGEPNPSTPGKRGGKFQENRLARLRAAGYTGPAPGSAEFKALRAAGKKPIAEFRASKGGLLANVTTTMAGRKRVVQPAASTSSPPAKVATKVALKRTAPSRPAAPTPRPSAPVQPMRPRVGQMKKR